MGQFFQKLRVVVNLQVFVGQHLAQSREFRFRQSIRIIRIVLRAIDLSQVDYRMSGHGKSEAGLFVFNVANAGHHQSGSIQNRSERAQPRLIDVLRPEITQDSVREMAFQNFRRPPLPITKNLIKNTLLRALAEPEQQFGSRGRRAGTCIQPRNLYLAAGKARIDGWQIADHNGQEAEACTGFGYGQSAGKR